MSIYKMRTEFGKYAKPILYLIALIFIVGAVWQFGAAPQGTTEETERREKPLATVNGLPITQQEFDAVWTQAAKSASDQGMSSTLQLADMRSQIFYSLVQNRLLLTAARQMGIQVTSDDVDKRLDQLVVEYLKQQRRLVLGKLTPAQERLDPREDPDYRDELAKNDLSIKQQEDVAKLLNPRSQVEAQVAAEAVQKAIEKSVGAVTDKDVTNSYKVYQIRQIVLTPGKLPREQMMNRANKIVKEARSDADFAKLAKDNSQGPTGVTQYSFDSAWTFPPAVGKAIEKMKPGQVSDVIDAGSQLYIVKLETVQTKLPPKLDKKAKKERRDQIKQTRLMMAQIEFRQKMNEKSDVRVTDPEMLGYWQLMQAQQNAGNPAVYQKHRSMAVAALKRAITVDRGNTFATAKLAQTLQQDGQNKQALELLYQLMEGEQSTAQGADLRIMLGDLLVKEGKKDEALKQYQKASDSAVSDRTAHERLMGKFRELGRPELVAVEQQRIENIDKLMAERAKSMPKPTPKPVKSGG